MTRHGAQAVQNTGLPVAVNRPGITRLGSWRTSSCSGRRDVWDTALPTQMPTLSSAGRICHDELPCSFLVSVHICPGSGFGFVIYHKIRLPQRGNGFVLKNCFKSCFYALPLCHAPRYRYATPALPLCHALLISYPQAAGPGLLKPTASPRMLKSDNSPASSNACNAGRKRCSRKIRLRV